MVTQEITHEITKESFDNYYNEINMLLYNGYSLKFVEYLKNKFGDKCNFHLIFQRENYYPLTFIGSIKNINSFNNLPSSNYYIKKRNGSYGKNITITTNPNRFFNQYGIKENDYVVQKEIDTDLYKNKKYDYRVYLLILKINNKIKYGYYTKYVIRNSLYEFNNTNDIYSKLTNHHIYSLKELDKNFYILSDEFKKTHENKIKILNERVLNKIKDYEDEFKSLLNNHNFRILGVDYVAEKLTNKLFILELNATPGVYYKNQTKDYLKKYNNFHKNIIEDLNNLLYNTNSQDNNWIII
ncbi:putative tubulin-tyrosine ligase family protein [Cafeteria roenbergensis virus]|uniref:Putative tubulin-tyrosine ligase family protein n=1 Tax=Cafeteria roenbergensis virus (strain BV-PW1) TaxID=693272 RepID=E3T579_CROVB|nr:putative tubulin-tyrosine ligase family protein [Cafeteria roenbergensis virus BV-PW1]ADO67342.1 putative tubulin-tyrosine ligase family protein [Cafeteria roenbergensis virus BV-PW1]